MSPAHAQAQHRTSTYGSSSTTTFTPHAACHRRCFTCSARPLGAAPDLVDQLVDAWKPETDDERDLYRAFSRLEPLERLEVENENLRTTLEEVRSKLPPGLQGSPYPGMSSWMETGSGDGARPSTVDAFDKQVQENPEAAVQFVLSFEERSFPRSGETSREDAASCCATQSSNALPPALNSGPTSDEHPELKDTVVAGWGHTKATDDAEAIMNILASIDLVPVLEHGVSQFFMYAARSGAPWEQYPATDQFIEHVWAACATDKVFKHGDSPRLDWQVHQRPRRAGDRVLVRDVPPQVDRRRRRLAQTARGGPRLP